MRACRRPPSGCIAAQVAPGSRYPLDAPPRTSLRNVLPTSTPWDGRLRRQCRLCDACVGPAFNQDVIGYSCECNVVPMIRHCRPCNFNQMLLKQLYRSAIIWVAVTILSSTAIP